MQRPSSGSKAAPSPAIQRPLSASLAGTIALPTFLSEEDIEMCRVAFAKYDRDGSGAISAHELQATLVCECTAPSRPQPRGSA